MDSHQGKMINRRRTMALCHEMKRRERIVGAGVVTSKISQYQIEKFV
jgi:hypothetical protein